MPLAESPQSKQFRHLQARSRSAAEADCTKIDHTRTERTTIAHCAPECSAQCPATGEWATGEALKVQALVGECRETRVGMDKSGLVCCSG